MYASSETIAFDRMTSPNPDLSLLGRYTTERAVTGEIPVRFMLWIPPSGQRDTYARYFRYIRSAWQLHEYADARQPSVQC